MGGGVWPTYLLIQIIFIYESVTTAEKVAGPKTMECQSNCEQNILPVTCWHSIETELSLIWGEQKADDSN